MCFVFALTCWGQRWGITKTQKRALLSPSNINGWRDMGRIKQISMGLQIINDPHSWHSHGISHSLCGGTLYSRPYQPWLCGGCINNRFCIEIHYESCMCSEISLHNKSQDSNHFSHHTQIIHQAMDMACHFDFNRFALLLTTSILLHLVFVLIYYARIILCSLSSQRS